MKNALHGLAFCLILLGACKPTYVVHNDPPAPAPAPIPEPEVSYQSFYDELSPYGQWIDYPGYGYVWMPNAGAGFKPYATNGHWVYTDMGWTWASDYNWGWAAFHYGRWFYEPSYGWMWMPGNEWAPAWVSWRRSPDYYGWAPLGPNVSVSAGYYNPPSNYWCFVPHQYIGNPRANNYYINESRNVTIINNTTVINNTTIINNNAGDNRVSNRPGRVYTGGPDPQEVQRYTGSTVRPVALRESNRPGEQLNNGQYSIYRPRVNTNPQPAASGNRPQRIAPARVQPLRELRPATPANSSTTVQTGNDLPANRNNNNTVSPVNNGNANSNRPVSNPPATNTRPQNTVNDNQPANSSFNRNNNNNRNFNNPQPVNMRPATINNNQPADASDRNNAGRNPVSNPQPVNAARPAATSTRPVTTNNGAPVNNNPINRSPNNIQRNNAIRENSSSRPANPNPSNNNNRNGQRQIQPVQERNANASTNIPEKKNTTPLRTADGKPKPQDNKE
jgi:hypothetical protein